MSAAANYACAYSDRNKQREPAAWMDWEEGRRTEPTHLDAVGLAETLDELHGQPLARLRHRFRLSRRVSPEEAKTTTRTPRLRAGGDLREGKGGNEASGETPSPPLLPAAGLTGRAGVFGLPRPGSVAWASRTVPHKFIPALNGSFFFFF